MSATITHLQLW